MDSFYDEDGKVICQVCKKSFHFITPRHLNLHNMTSNEYKEKYNAPVFRKNFYVEGQKRGRKTFIEKEESVKKIQPVEIILNKPIIEELVEFKECDEIKNLSVNKVQKIKNHLDPMEDKNDIVDFLKTIYRGIEINSFITKYDKNNSIIYSYMTDIIDRKSKTIFDFPNSFWHNTQTGISNHIKKRMLEDDGWNFVEITATMPRLHHIREKISSLNS